MTVADGRDETLLRIAEALERLSPRPLEPTDWLAHPAYVWDGDEAREIASIEAPRLDQLRAIERQKARVHENIARLAAGSAAHDMLLWGARGMGKSALLRAAMIDVQRTSPQSIALVQVSPDAMKTLPALFAQLARVQRQFVIFLDDLGFAEGDTSGPRRLRSWLEGGVEARAPNSRLAVTTNRRAILTRQASEQASGGANGPLNNRDAIDDQLALADRFGLTVGFHPCSQDEYLEIVRGYADPHGIAFDEAEALEWTLQRGQRSGRAAWQFVVELAGKAGQSL